MNSFFIILARRLRRFRLPYCLAALLVAVVLTGILLYQGYVAALSSRFRGNLLAPTLPGDIVARRFLGSNDPVVVKAEPVLRLHLWPILTAQGWLEVAGVGETRLPQWPAPQSGQVWLPASLEGRVFSHSVGDSLVLTYLGKEGRLSARAEVAGYYDDGGLVSPLLANQTWLAAWLGAEAHELLLAYPETAQTELKRWQGNNEGAQLLYRGEAIQQASNLVGSVYAGGKGVVVLGLAFLALGLGTLALLVFLDSHPEFAVLKALGLKSGTTAGLLGLEFALASGMGLALAWLALSALKKVVSFPLILDGRLLGQGSFLTATAFLAALAAPMRLAKVALVNELMLGRPILLWKQVITKGPQNLPAFSDLTEAGLTCLKLQQDGQGFQGAILQKQGKRVRQGETLAWESIWFGMGERHYAAPHDGILQVVDLQRGVLALKESRPPSLPKP